jgi:hypothetical protein
MNSYETLELVIPHFIVCIAAVEMGLSSTGRCVSTTGQHERMSPCHEVQAVSHNSEAFAGVSPITTTPFFCGARLKFAASTPRSDSRMRTM